MSTKTAEKAIEEKVTDLLAHNLAALMGAHPLYFTRPALARKTGVSARTLTAILGGKANPTLKYLESIADAFRLEVWELLMPGLDVSKVATKVSPEERILHRRIQQSMNALGVKEYKIRPDKT